MLSAMARELVSERNGIGELWPRLSAWKASEHEHQKISFRQAPSLPRRYLLFLRKRAFVPSRYAGIQSAWLKKLFEHRTHSRLWAATGIVLR